MSVPLHCGSFNNNYRSRDNPSLQKNYRRKESNNQVSTLIFSKTPAAKRPNACSEVPRHLGLLAKHTLE